MLQLSVDAVVATTPWCVCRPQEDRYLIYNSRSDELHLISPTGYAIYSQCDGLRSVEEIRRLFDHGRNRGAPIDGDPILGFIWKLVARGVLEVEDGHAR